MNVLIDTHVFIWWTTEPRRLSAMVSGLLTDPSTTVLLSFASIWEMQIKLTLGKLRFETALSELVDDEINRNRFELLPIKLSHIYAVDSLPLHHRDPFDRLLIAQSKIEDIQILSIDEVFDDYGVSRLW